MTGTADPLRRLQQAVAEFVREREWEPFQSPKNLAMALTVEASELAEHFQWLECAESRKLDPRKQLAVGYEMADVMIYLARLADVLGVDLWRAVDEKLRINAEKYPAERVRGSAKKYWEYD